MNSLAEPIEQLDQSTIARLLAPLSADAPCGPAARYDPVFTEIRLLREEDDPHLPMGQWERPLKRADWPAIEARCVAMLSTRSKDLHIAVWLVEAWMRQHGFDGLRQGLRLLDALLRAYWEPLHPRIELDEAVPGAALPEADVDARLAPLEWLNESLSASLRVHTVLVSVHANSAGKPTPVTLADWERMTMHEMALAPPAGRNQPAREPPFLRADIVDGVSGLQAELAWTQTAIEDCQQALAAIAGFLRARLARLAPNLGKLAASLEAARRVLSQLYDSTAGAAGDDLAALVATSIAVDDDEDDPRDLVARDPGAAAHRDVMVSHCHGDGAAWHSRQDAYATLAALADYLAEVEPHSPTPFLLRRAVNWGRMSLPEVIAEIIREEGDVNRFFNVLGVRH